MKPKSKQESNWKTALWELKYICHTRATKKWIKRQASKATRKLGKILTKGD